MVEKSKELAVHGKLNEHGSFVLETALWFYNISHLFDGNYTGVAVLAADFLKLQGVGYELTREVCLLIMSMRDRSSSGFIEAIMYDATSFDLADPAFLVRNDQLRLEKVALGQHFNRDEIWQQELIMLMESHRFYTSYAVSTWDEGKRRNLNVIKEKLRTIQRNIDS